MTVYLIECGQQFVLYVKERKKYFIVDRYPDYLQQFVQGKMVCDQWQGGKTFQWDRSVDLPSEEALLALFYLPENNPGAVIASRSETDQSPKIYNKYAFLKRVGKLTTD